ncbi:MAG: sodium:solute symporter family protein [Clostridiales bacterium]|nr:sodium:solute symporter family protein [Clostridiales bacterium]
MDWLNYTVFGLYILGMIAIAYYSRKRTATVKDTLLGNRNTGGWMSAFAYGATYFSAVVFVGYAGGFGYKYGIAVISIGIGNALIGSLMPWLLFSRKTRRITRTLDVKTMPEYFEARYETKRLKLISAAIILIFLIPYSASVYQGLGYIFEQALGIPFAWIIVILAALTALYLFFGGYYATTLSDFFQGIIMLLGIVLMIVFVYNHDKVNGIINGIMKIEEWRAADASVGDAGNNLYTLISLVLLTSLGTWGLPQIVHKFYTVRNENAIKKATWVSTGFAVIISAGAYFVGVVAVLVVGREIPSGNRMAQLMIETLPAGVLGLILVLLLSASMSTLSGIALVSGGAGAVDIFKGFIFKKAKDKTVNLIMKLICLGVVLISAIIAAFNPTTIVNLMSFSWGVLGGCFIGPFIYGLYMKKASKAAAYTSIIGALSLTLGLYIISRTVPATAAWLAPPAIGVYSMIFSLIVTPIVSRFTAPPSQELLDKIMVKTDEKAWTQETGAAE